MIFLPGTPYRIQNESDYRHNQDDSKPFVKFALRYFLSQQIYNPPNPCCQDGNNYADFQNTESSKHFIFLTLFYENFL